MTVMTLAQYTAQTLYYLILSEMFGGADPQGSSFLAKLWKLTDPRFNDMIEIFQTRYIWLISDE